MTLTAHATVHVPVSPARAFELFTEDIGRWWKRGTMYWNDRDRGLRYSFENGQLLEHYADAEPFVVGEIEAWDPGVILGFTWRQGDWAADATTSVVIRFVADGDGTRLDLEHSGWEAVNPAMAEGYTRGWKEILGWYLAAV